MPAETTPTPTVPAAGTASAGTHTSRPPAVGTVPSDPISSQVRVVVGHDAPVATLRPVAG